MKRTGGDTSKAVTVNWTLKGSTNNSATVAAEGSDFNGDQLPSGTLTFGPDETEKTIEVRIKDDGKIEKTEGFTVTLSGEKNATINSNQNQASSSITDNDKLTLRLQKDSGKEGDNITNNNKVLVDNVPAGQEWEYRFGKTGDWQKGSDNHQLTLPDNDAIRGKKHIVQARVKGIDSSLVEKEFTYDKLTYLDNVDFDKDGTSIVVVGKAEPGATIEVGRNKATVADNGTFKLTLPNTSASGNGFLNLTVKTTDIAGNTESQTHSVRQFGSIYRDEANSIRDQINSSKNTTIIAGEKGALGDIGSEVAGWRFTNPLDFGAGDDALIVAGSLQGSRTDIRMGADNDTVRVKAYMRAGAKIDMGAGDDYIKLGDESLGTGRDLGIGTPISSILGGASLKLGAGNDTAELRFGINGAKLDGGSGFDTLNFTGSKVKQGLDVITGMEVINLTGTGGNTLTVRKSDVLNNADTATTINGKSYQGLFIKGNKEDTVDLGGSDSSRKDKLGGFVKDTRKGQAPEGYDAYWDGSDDKTHVFIQKGIEVI